MRIDSLNAPLAGATVVVTRPAGTQASFRRAVRRLGGRPLSLPGSSLRAEPARLATGERFDAWIFTSPAAVRFAAPLLHSVRRRDDVFAVGEGTARALARRGLRASVPAERADSEGLLALSGLENVLGRRIALVGAPGGRDLIAPALAGRGARVQRIDVYRRRPPRLTRRHFDAIASAPDPLITLVSSAEALANLSALLPTPLLSRLRRQRLVVSSARLADAARGLGFVRVLEARSALPRDLLASAAEALTRRR